MGQRRDDKLGTFLPVHSPKLYQLIFAKLSVFITLQKPRPCHSRYGPILEPDFPKTTVLRRTSRSSIHSMEKIEEKPCSTHSMRKSEETHFSSYPMEHPGSINNNLSCRYLVPSLVKHTSVRRHQLTTYKMLEDANLTKPNDVRGSKMRPKRCQRMQRRGKSTLTMVLRSQVKQYKSNSVKSNFLLRRKEKLESVIRVLKKFQLKYVGCQIGADLNEKIKNLSNECDYVSLRLNLILKSQGNKPIFYEWSGGSKKLM